MGQLSIFLTPLYYRMAHNTHAASLSPSTSFSPPRFLSLYLLRTEGTGGGARVGGRGAGEHRGRGGRGR